MPMLKRPWEKYEPFVGPSLINRTWPSKTIKCAPRWLATDLRDGNQSLESPMTTIQKMTYFKMLVDLGYKEIEVSTPTASDTEYNFTRQLIDTAGAVPDDVWLQVLCPCRLDLIQRTVQSLQGANKAIISLYFASSPVWLDTVFGMSEQDVYDRVVQAVEYLKCITKDNATQNGTTWNSMFSPEAFSGSEMSFCLRLCEAAKAAWVPTAENPIILNLPATMEMSTPNVYADQVEIFSTSISERDKVCVSLHVHNDRGCSVAAAELGLLAGGERIEGCLFGNGERAGNVDLVTLALNLYSQGIDPRVDYSNISSVREVVETSTKIKVHPRAPYAGELFFAAYSGAHQDGIHKGLTKFKAKSDDHRCLWKVPYLPIDPEDLGLSRADIIRLNSQSGKGGVGWTLLHELQVDLPRGLQHHFSKIVKRVSEAIGGTVTPSDVVGIFLEHYFISKPDERIVSAELTPVEGPVRFNATKFTVDPPRKDLSTLVVVECQSEGYVASGWGVRSFNGTAHCLLLAALSAALDLLGQKMNGAMLVCRFLGGVFGCSPMAIFGGFLANIWDPVERGIALCSFAGATFIGPLAGPIVGTFLTTSSLGWRWTQWLTLILFAVFGAIAWIAVPETYAPVILSRRATPARSPLTERRIDFKAILVVYILRPFKMLFWEPILLLLTVYLAFVYGILYLWFFSYPIAFHQERGWTERLSSLPFLAIIIGIALGCIYIAVDTSTRYARKMKKFGSVSPEERLPPMIVGAILLPAGFFLFAWTSNKEITWVPQVLAGIPTGAGVFIIFIQGLSCIIDVYLMHANSALAGNGLIRSIFGAAFPLFAKALYQRLGISWATSLLGFISVTMAPVPVLFWFYGKRIRAWSKMSQNTM